MFGKTSSWVNYLFIFVVICLFLWPLSFFIYVSKWDNIDCYLPYRYFVSDMLHNGVLPFWNPYQQMGIPSYSETQNGMYSPIVWFLMLFGKYTSVSLTIELLIYYILGGVGMFKIISLFSKDTHVQFFGAFSFVFSGFMMGTSQIMIFVAGIALLPWIIYYLTKLLHYYYWKDALKLVLVLALQITSASPAYTIILVYILSFYFIVFSIKNWGKVSIKKNFYQTTGAAIITLAILSPYIIAIFEFIPFMGRASKLKYGDFLLENSYRIGNFISLISPTATLANSNLFEGTDLTMRSSYIGLLPLIFAIFTLKFYRNFWVITLWICAILFGLLSMGKYTPLYKFMYDFAPGFGLFRHPAFFRSYLIFILVILGSYGFHQFKTQENSTFLKYSLYSLGILFIGLFVATGWEPYGNEIKSYISNWDKSSPTIHYSMRTYILVHAVIILFLMLVFYSWFKKKNQLKKVILIFTIIELGIYAQLTSSYTLHYNLKQNDFIHFFNQLPNEIHQESAQQPYHLNVEDYQPKQEGIWRNTATFAKSLTISAHNQAQFKGFNILEENKGLEITAQNPLFYDINEKVLLDTVTVYKPNLVWDWTNRKALNINSNSLKINDSKIGYNEFYTRFENQSNQTDILVINQNYHPLWQAFINGKPTQIYSVNQALMAIEIPANSKGTVQYKFESTNAKKFIFYSLFLYLLLILGIFIKTNKFYYFRTHDK
jgi:hypothetical protein